MSTKWVVTTPVDRIDLNDAQQAETTFTVTNPGDRPDRVYFDLVAGDGADTAWFTVDEPQRRVPANGSVSYLVKTAVPATAKAGSYSVQGRAYSADSAPEEDSVLSGRLAIEVKPKAAPAAKKKFPWWIVVIAALVVIVLVVVGILVFGGGKSSPSGTAPGQSVTVPDLTHQSQAQAKTNLGAFGLTVGTVRHTLATPPDQVLYQSVPGGSKADRGTAVDLVVSTDLGAPTITGPANNTSVPAAAVQPPTTPLPTAPATATRTATASSKPATGVITWTDPDAFVSHWQVTIAQATCVSTPFIPQVPVPPGTILNQNNCYTQVISITRVDAAAYTPFLPGQSTWSKPGVAATVQATYTVTVSAVDDFGKAGPASAPVTFLVK